MAPYDLVKEALLAFAFTLIIVIILAILFSSPDEPPLTIQSVALQTPRTFLSVAIGDLDGKGEIASYGPPYNNGSGSVQYLGPISLQKLAGVTIPIDPRQDFVLAPLEQAAQSNPALATTLKTFLAASPAQQQRWEAAYAQALPHATHQGATVRLPAGAYGPVQPLLDTLLRLGQQGALDGDLLVSLHHFYQTDYTKPLLFIQGKPLHDKARPLHFLGEQWGMMNESGNWPGQEWLWLYTFWYQIPPYSTSPNGDADVWLTMAILTVLFIILPFIPGLNQLPRKLRVYRLIWRSYYREQESPQRK